MAEEEFEYCLFSWVRDNNSKLQAPNIMSVCVSTIGSQQLRTAWPGSQGRHPPTL